MTIRKIVVHELVCLPSNFLFTKWIKTYVEPSVFLCVELWISHNYEFLLSQAVFSAGWRVFSRLACFWRVGGFFLTGRWVLKTCIMCLDTLITHFLRKVWSRLQELYFLRKIAEKCIFSSSNDPFKYRRMTMHQCRPFVFSILGIFLKLG